MKLFRTIIFGLSGILLFAGCQDGLFFSKYQAVDDFGWQSRDTLVYKLPEVEYVGRYDMKVNARIAQDYKYGNLAFAVKIYEGRHLMSADTVFYNIYDENGENCGKGFPFVEHEAELKHPVTLAPKKKCKVKISHIMRLDPLDGVCDVGIELLSL